MSNMYQRLKNLREDQRLSQKAVAHYLRCDQSLYSKYELGKRIVPLEVMSMLADFYNTSIDYLVGRTDQKDPYPKAIF